MRKTGTKPFFSLSRGVKPPAAGVEDIENAQEAVGGKVAALEDDLQIAGRSLQLFALHDQPAAVLVVQRDGEGIDGVAVQQLGHIRETLADQVLF